MANERKFGAECETRERLGGFTAQPIKRVTLTLTLALALALALTLTLTLALALALTLALT